jgi:cytochrome c556
MKKFLRLLVLFKALLLPAGYSFGEPKIPNTTQMLMKQKLAAAHGLLDGIVRDDYESLKKNADLLKSMSKASTWHKSDSDVFLSYARSFQNAADFLVANAQAKNREGITLGYIRVTLECVQCHNHVRDQVKQK